MSTKPFDSSHFVGYVKKVSPDYVTGHIPASRLLSLYHHFGEKFHSGIVGNFVVIEGEEYGFLGRILEIDVTEKERSALTELSFENEELQPQIKIEILISFDYYDQKKVRRGLDSFPHVGAKIYGCTSTFLQARLEKIEEPSTVTTTFNIGHLTADSTVPVNVSPQALFSRHCAIVGTTGGGKSWTVAKLLEDLISSSGKVILIDATGEYSTFTSNPKVVSVDIGVDSFLHYSNLNVSDLFYLLRPSDKVQKPKLMEAIRSLKAVNLTDGKVLSSNYFDSEHKPTTGSISIENGILKKTGAVRKIYEAFCHNNIEKVESPKVNFNIKKLALQITEECIFDTEKVDKNYSGLPKFGPRDETAFSYCTSLISRVHNLVTSANFTKVFGFDEPEPNANDLIVKLNEFLVDDNKSILRINLSEVSFEFQTREILADAIGRQLHAKALSREFKGDSKKSVLIIMDEAHQFMNKTVQDEYSPIQPLDAFERIAKETRKFGLFLCLATQMPRDIPLGTLSQMGTFIIHRLINKYDKEAVQSACSTANQASMSFLPVLGSGEAILLSVELPMPLSLKIKAPAIKPDSDTPKVICP